MKSFREIMHRGFQGAQKHAEAEIECPRELAASEVVAMREPPAAAKSKIWGRNPDGTPYAVGLTVAQLRKALDRFEDADEVCMVICRKNGSGPTGKLVSLQFGSSQIWLEGVVLDESQE